MTQIIVRESAAGVSSHPHYRYFFSTGEESILYNTVEEIAKYLSNRPLLVSNYNESMMSLANIHASSGDYRGMRETLNLLVDVRIRVAQLRGEECLS